MAGRKESDRISSRDFCDALAGAEKKRSRFFVMLYSIESPFYCSLLNNNANCVVGSLSIYPNDTKHLVKEMKGKMKAEKKAKKNVPPKNMDTDVRAAVIPMKQRIVIPETQATMRGVRRFYCCYPKYEWSEHLPDLQALNDARWKKMKAQANWGKVRNAVRARPYVFHWIEYHYRPDGAGRKRDAHMFEFGDDPKKTLEPASYDQSLMDSHVGIWFQLWNQGM